MIEICVKRFLLPVLFLFFFHQNNYGQLPDSLKNYYRLVNKAELAIVDSNYIEALRIYENAFTYNVNSFKKDVYNQAVCAVLINDYKKAYSNFKCLTDYGYEIDSLNSKKELVSFFNSKYGRKLKKHYKKGIILYNSALREKYDSLLIIDQFFRLKDERYSLYKDSIQKIDISNVNVLNRLIKKYGFPNESLIGVYPDFDNLPIKTIVLHNRVGNTFGQKFNYTEILFKALYKGLLEANLAIELITASMGDETYCAYFFTNLVKIGLDEKNFPKETSDWGFYRVKEKEEKYNKEREQLGLCTLFDSRKKNIFSLKDNRFKFASSTFKKYYFNNKKDYKYALKKLIFIK